MPQPAKPANKHRGEVVIHLVDREWVMRPTHEAIAEIESATGRGILSVFRDFIERDIRFTDMSEVIAAGVRAGGESMATAAGIRELLFREGLNSERLYDSLSRFMLGMLNGGKTDADDDDVGEATDSPDTPSGGS